jgi:hypothetical protein
MAWKFFEQSLIRQRQWELDMPQTDASFAGHEEHYYHASLFHALGAPNLPKTLSVVRVVLVSSSPDSVRAASGRNGEQTLMFRRHQQAHFLVTGFCGATAVGPDSCFLTMTKQDNIACTMAKSAAILNLSSLGEQNCIVFGRIFWWVIVLRMSVIVEGVWLFC